VETLVQDSVTSLMQARPKGQQPDPTIQRLHADQVVARVTLWRTTVRTNLKARNTLTTHEGAPAKIVNAEAQLRRSVMSCLLFEDEFYEDGEEIATRIERLAAQVKPEIISAIAIEARKVNNLRHVPLLLARILAKIASGPIVGDTIAAVVERADELTEFMALYWKGGRQPLDYQVKKGLRKAFPKFDAYQLAKYDRDGVVKLRDVMRMVHPKPANDEQAALWKGVIDRTLAAPDTWEVALSGGADKKEAFERLLRDEKLGYMALLRNLRNMAAANVDNGLIKNAILARKGAHRVLPFRYIAAARAVPQMEPVIDQALCEAISELPIMSGKTVILVDVSRSMIDKLSGKSDMLRIDAAAALASIIPGDVRVFSFSDEVVEVPPRRGMAGVDAIQKSQVHNGTRLFDAVAAVNKEVQHDRMIVITDEQATGSGIFGYRIQGHVSSMPDPVAKGYLINVASAQNGVGYGKWVHIDGFSESVLKFIIENERQRVN
jgi:60 kDa SS-A/Ro ribonucleoprotein